MVLWTGLGNLVPMGSAQPQTCPEMQKPPYKNDLTGKVFNYLTGVSYAGKFPSGQAAWIFRCVCGVEKRIQASAAVSGNTKSCGCKTGLIIADKKTKHGGAYTVEYKTWKSITQRCNNPNNKNYDEYRLRAPRVPYSFPEFIAAVGARPSDKHSIERKDNNGTYDLDNLRWATVEDQIFNKSNTAKYVSQNRLCTLREACDLIGENYVKIYKRTRRGQTIEAASAGRIRPATESEISYFTKTQRRELEDM